MQKRLVNTKIREERNTEDAKSHPNPAQNSGNPLTVPQNSGPITETSTDIEPGGRQDKKGKHASQRSPRKTSIIKRKNKQTNKQTNLQHTEQRHPDPKTRETAKGRETTAPSPGKPQDKKQCRVQPRIENQLSTAAPRDSNTLRWTLYANAIAS